MIRKSYILLTDKNLEGEGNLNETSEKERLQASNLGTTDSSSSKNANKSVPDGKYRYLY
jgi:hypothetical protein